MTNSRKASAATPLFAAAAVSYAANCALGTAVAAKLVDSSGFRGVHHALYIVTCAAVAIAVGTGLTGQRRRESRLAALALAPAAVPLAAIAYVPTHSRRHPLVALMAAPFITASLVISLRCADGK